MSTAVVLGLRSPELEVYLTTGADFTAELTYKVDDVVTSWPVGTALSLVFANGQTWTASVVTSTATFAKDKADVALIPNGIGVKLMYVNGTTDRALAVGSVSRRD